MADHDLQPGKRSDPSIATVDGAVQFHLIGQRTNDPSYSDVLQENADILMGMGGLISNYMQRTYPTVDRRLMSIDLWEQVLQQVPDLSVDPRVRKTYATRIPGTQVAGQLLGLLADASIADGAPLLGAFASYLGAFGDLAFDASAGSQSYDVMTCTFQSYLIEKGWAGAYDYAAIVVRQVKVVDGFQGLKSSCASTNPVSLNLEYTEVRALAQMARLRRGGIDHNNFQALLNAAATRELQAARNFFNGGGTPLLEIQPKV